MTRSFVIVSMIVLAWYVKILESLQRFLVQVQEEVLVCAAAGYRCRVPVPLHAAARCALLEPGCRCRQVPVQKLLRGGAARCLCVLWGLDAGAGAAHKHVFLSGVFAGVIFGKGNS